MVRIYYCSSYKRHLVLRFPPRPTDVAASLLQVRRCADNIHAGDVCVNIISNSRCAECGSDLIHICSCYKRHLLLRFPPHRQMSLPVCCIAGVPITFTQTSSQQMRSVWFLLDVLATVPIFEFIGDGHFAGLNKLLRIFKVLCLMVERLIDRKLNFRSN